ncbi:MAG: hybrid sensor histidine kinase/response regulator [Trichocoleus desertorum ATA4-8-CV12]|jgi:two-component system sensor histidine kinase and response regulator WspE|nr:hybrid sensor histidine kinase/response regulator [Trichocoleus desertorum ATA4-8-CV12]
MLELFRMEVEAQATVLNHGLLELETNPGMPETLESLMRAAHSIKGAARIIDLEVGVKLAHVMEDCFTSAQMGVVTLAAAQIDVLLQGVDLLLRLSCVPETQLQGWLAEQADGIEALLSAIATLLNPQPQPLANELPQINELPAISDLTVPIELTPVVAVASEEFNPAPILEAEAIATHLPTVDLAKVMPFGSAGGQIADSPDRVVRVSADNLSRLMGLAGESLVEANWLQPFADSLLKLRRQQTELSTLIEKLQGSLVGQTLNQRSENYLNAVRQQATSCREMLSDRLNELELFARRSANLSDRLYREVLASHMRPFADGVQAFPRMVRDLGRQLDKQIRFEVLGKATDVDRDILEKLEAPLTHLLRNAVDHGIEPMAERLAAGKPAEGLVRLEAVHQGGMLSITVSDDGRGMDFERLRTKIVSKQLVSPEMAPQLTEAELIEFLFLPGFSTSDTVTELSGRGVGLNIVQNMIQEVGGSLRAVSKLGKGMTFYLQLPLTLSVIRTLLVEIAGEPYALPLTRIDRIAMVEPEAIAVAENRQFFTIDGQNIGLVVGQQVLELPASAYDAKALPVIVISDRLSCYGLVVDRFLGERDLVVRPLDSRLGKVKNISAAALLEDGSPVLLIDVEDMVRSIDHLLTNGQLSHISRKTEKVATKAQKRVLVVDDSITVREMERKLLQNKGYAVEVAVNGIDGWNAIRTGHFDLIVTDIDMPRMNGIELIAQLKQHATLKALPVIIVSYKDREEDRMRGLEVGADYYLTKSSFHDDTLLHAVRDLIGEAIA